jgi:hypothetical protein
LFVQGDDDCEDEAVEKSHEEDGGGVDETQGGREGEYVGEAADKAEDGEGERTVGAEEQEHARAAAEEGTAPAGGDEEGGAEEEDPAEEAAAEKEAKRTEDMLKAQVSPCKIEMKQLRAV